MPVKTKANRRKTSSVSEVYLLEKLRLRLASSRMNTLLLSVLGVGVGVIAGTVIIALRLIIELGQSVIFLHAGAEQYESLAWWMILLLPILGGLIIDLMAGIIPVLFAAVTATGLCHLVFGTEATFSVPILDALPLINLPWIFVTGLVAGLVAVVFIRLLLFFSQQGIQ